MPQLPTDSDIIRQAADAVIFADTDGVIRRWNEAATRIFGYSGAQALGQSLDIIIPEKLRAAHWAGYQAAIAATSTKYAGQSLPTKAIRSDGSEMYVELSFSIISDNTGAALGALAIARDITARFAEERKLRQRLAEFEKGKPA